MNKLDFDIKRRDQDHDETNVTTKGIKGLKERSYKH